MDTKELLSKIAKLKSAIEIETDPDVIKAYRKKVDSLEKQIAEAEQKVEKVEAKAAAEEKKDLSEAEIKIKKLKSAIEVETDPEVKERYQKKVKQLEETLKDVKQEIKEEKKEIAEQKKDIKQATKEVKSAQKEVRKTAIKKVAAKQVERKQVVTRKAKRKTKIKTIISDLDKLINKNKELKAKYKGKGVDLKKDASRSAKPFGYRFVGKHDYRVPTEAQIRRGLKRGTIDYEARPNRSDKYPKGQKSSYAKLADGGMMMAKGAKIRSQKEYNELVLEKDKIVKNLSPKEVAEMWNKLNKPTIDKGVGSKMTESEAKMSNSKMYLRDLLVENELSEAEFKKYFEDGGMMRRGGRTKEAITADKRYKALKAGRRVSEDGNVYYESRANRSDVSRRDKLADGGTAGYKYTLEEAKRMLDAEKSKSLDFSWFVPDIDYEGEDYDQEYGVHLSDKGLLELADEIYGDEMMRRGGRTKASITADKRYKALKAGRRVSADGNVYYESRANRSDVSRRDKLADGGSLDDKREVLNQYTDEKLARIYSEMNDLDYSDVLIDLKGNPLERKEIVNEIVKEIAKRDGMMARGGAVKKKVASKSNPKPSNKVGKSIQDKHRFAKPAGWRWKEEAFEKRIIERKQLAMSPSKKMRDKYPNLVYFEDRLNKADAKPTRTSADSI
jgi:hypothetical protein